MADAHNGKFFLFYLLLFCDFPRFSHETDGLSSNPPDSINKHVNEHKLDIADALDVFNRHQLQLEKLEELVRNLTELVSKFESQFSECPKVKMSGNVDQKIEEKAIEEKKIDGDGFSRKIVDGLVESNVNDGEKMGAMSVTKYSPFWSERFQFVSAVRLGSNATCINVLPFKDFDGLSKYFALGDERGRVYVFLRSGDVILESFTMLDSPVTAMVSYLSVYKNESLVVTGHENGAILMHKVWEVSNGEDWGSLRMENIGRFNSPEVGKGGSSITILEVHHVGRNRYVLSTDYSGKIRVFRENGTVYGVAVPTSRPLAFLKQRLLFLTETGAGSLDLRTMRIRESECEGLNSSVAKSYVFDATERSKAYGFTSDGDLIHLLLLGDIMNFKCRVRSKKKFDMSEPLAFQAIKGYLLITNQEKVWVYNVSSQNYVRVGGPRLLFAASLDDILALFLNYQPSGVNNWRSTVIPLIASDREKLVILSLGCGYVGIYRSNLPVFKNEFNTILWTSPVLFFILFLFGAWHFFANKKEALTSWGPDDPFSSTSVINAASMGSGSGDRAFADPTRNSDIMDLRGSGLRGPTGRYVSPSRYPGGSANPYRPVSSETNPRSSSVDPNFRTSSELKFRGSNVEAAGFPKRREGLYVNSQIVDESS